MHRACGIEKLGVGLHGKLDTMHWKEYQCIVNAPQLVLHGV